MHLRARALTVGGGGRFVSYMKASFIFVFGVLRVAPPELFLIPSSQPLTQIKMHGAHNGRNTFPKQGEPNRDPRIR